jgi:hypothetical protein
MKEALLSELPRILEQIDDVAKKIYDPSQIWLESMQFADYVTQLAIHLTEGHGDECVTDIAEQLQNMSNSFKQMGENALRALDEVEKAENEYGS